ncbi:phytanoyl-CoA dioxygenase family protein [Rhodobacteraceae bacterium NNCM2]|nr:phytanoyl-CoA dioxygenase family protein [Coraliihabitans acroporae]
MTPDQIRETPCRTIDPTLREKYLEEGACVVEKAVTGDWLTRLREAVDRFVEQSRGVTEPGPIFDLEKGHSAENPRLRRVSSPCDHDPVFWEVLTKGPVGDVAADLLGPDVKFYQSKLNFKWAKGGAEVKWHQDQPFFPHTNHAVATFGVYLNDCGPEQGPLQIMPGSHKGKIYDHYDEQGVWRGEIRPDEMKEIDTASSTELQAPAGSITVHNYITLHGSRPNQSEIARPLLLYVLSAADAAPYTSQPLKSRYEQQIVRGNPASRIHHVEGSFRVPPDWSGGYTSIFATQQAEGQAAAM